MWMKSSWRSQSWLSTATNSFDAYAARKWMLKVLDLAKLTEYEALKLLLNAYEGLYANGAVALQGELFAQSGTKDGCLRISCHHSVKSITNQADTDQNQTLRTWKLLRIHANHLPRKKPVRSKQWKTLWWLPYPWNHVPKYRITFTKKIQNQ